MITLFITLLLTLVLQGLHEVAAYLDYHIAPHPPKGSVDPADINGEVKL